MMQIKIIPNESSNPPGKLADVELHFVDSGTFDYAGLQGLKLIGFAVWERRHGSGRNVTFPARQYSVNGERRSFALLRPHTDTNATQRLVDLILKAYDEHQNQDTAAGLDTFPARSQNEHAAADSQTTTAPDADPDLDAERTRGAFDADACARELWRRMTDNERAGVKYGLFPAHLFSGTSWDRDQQHAVTVALMNIPTGGKLEEPKPITKPARYTPPARSQAPLGF